MEWKSCNPFHEQTHLFHSERTKGMDLVNNTNQIWKSQHLEGLHPFSFINGSENPFRGPRLCNANCNVIGNAEPSLPLRITVYVFTYNC